MSRKHYLPPELDKHLTDTRDYDGLKPEHFKPLAEAALKDKSGYFRLKMEAEILWQIERSDLPEHIKDHLFTERIHARLADLKSPKHENKDRQLRIAMAVLWLKSGLDQPIMDTVDGKDILTRVAKRLNRDYGSVKNDYLVGLKLMREMGIDPDVLKDGWYDLTREGLPDGTQSD